MKTRKIESRLTPINDSYETCERTAATLRIITQSFSVDKITDLLKVSPSRTHVSHHPGHTETGAVERQIWLLESEEEVHSRDLRRHLDWIVGAIYPKKEELLRLQEVSDVKMDVTCVWWSRYGDGGPTLWPEQMARLAELNLEISIACSYYGED